MHLHKFRNRTIYISPCNSAIISRLKELSINIIESACIPELIEYERYHADMQMLLIDRNIFIPENCDKLQYFIREYADSITVCDELGSVYPDNVKLNAALIGRFLFCREKSLDDKVRKYCVQHNIKIINVNQGYTKCSTLVVTDDAIITADTGIHTAAQGVGIDSLLIAPGNIRLCGADYGFVGGASGRIGDTIVFFGDIHRHPQSKEICDFITAKGLSYLSLSDEVLCDIGGLIEL